MYFSVLLHLFVVDIGDVVVAVVGLLVGGSTDEDNLVRSSSSRGTPDVAIAQAGILHGLAARLNGGAYQDVFRFYYPFTQILIKSISF